MKPTLNWFDKLMIAITYAEENVYETSREPKKGKRPVMHNLGKHLAKAGA
jgi:hypothetical protein